MRATWLLGLCLLGGAVAGAVVPGCGCDSGTSPATLGAGGDTGATVTVSPPTASLVVELGGSATQAFTATAVS
jgi:hypothetical protein